MCSWDVFAPSYNLVSKKSNIIAADCLIFAIKKAVTSNRLENLLDPRLQTRRDDQEERNYDGEFPKEIQKLTEAFYETLCITVAMSYSSFEKLARRKESSS